MKISESELAFLALVDEKTSNVLFYRAATGIQELEEEFSSIE